MKQQTKESDSVHSTIGFTRMQHCDMQSRDGVPAHPIDVSAAETCRHRMQRMSKTRHTTQ